MDSEAVITSQGLKPWNHHIYCHENEFRSFKKATKTKQNSKEQTH